MTLFETILSSQFECAFQRWKETQAPHDTGEDYDWRGAFVAGCRPDSTGHWPDLFKKPNHPTFSTDSIYAVHCPQLAGKWDGARFIPPSRNDGDVPDSEGSQ